MDTFVVGFIDFMLKSKGLLEYTDLFSPNKYKKNDNMVLKDFLLTLNELKQWKYIVIFVIKMEKLKS